jgi:predicted RNA binding protein YcfA (HicA-like mRNA interferase family)
LFKYCRSISQKSNWLKNIPEPMKVRDIVKMLEKDGWYIAATKGSHRQYKHPVKSGRVTIAGHPNDDLAPGTLNSILKQARLKEV